MSDAPIDREQSDRPWPGREELQALYAQWDPEMRLAANRMPRIVPFEGESQIEVARRHYWTYVGALLGLGTPFQAASVLAADLTISMYDLSPEFGPVAGHA